jgi:AhpD family alkylhydroperoxidase
VTDHAHADGAGPPGDPLVANDPAFYGVFGPLYEEAWGDGAIPARYKELAGVTLSVVIRCEPCLGHHVRMAHAAGATLDQFAEALRLGVLAGGSAGIPTARRAYAVLDELEATGSNT